MENIFKNMCAKGSRLAIISSFVGGITILHPTEDAEKNRVEVDLTSSAQQMVLDFLTIGSELERIVPISAYVPFYLENSINKSAWSKYRGNMEVRFSAFKDELCPFLSNIEVKKNIENYFLQFLNSYCAMGFHQAPWLLSAAMNKFAFHNGIIQHQDKFAIAPLTSLVYQFAEVYYRYKYPLEFVERLEACHNQTSISVADDVTILRAEIELTSIFENGIWREYKKIKSPLDLVKIHLMYSDTTEYKQCKYCGTYFATDNKRALYCSPTCRNRANVKRNYDKKKKYNLSNELSQ